MREQEHTHQRLDVYQAVTDQIVRAIEQGAGQFQLPWYRETGRIGCPVNSHTGESYRGVNVITLWASAMSGQFGSGYWASYRQWQALGAQVRKGAKGSLIVFYKTLEMPLETKDDSDEKTRKRIPLARASYVFNAEQVEGWAPPPAPASPGILAHSKADTFIEATGATIRHGGDRAYYSPRDDFIQIPERERFLGTPTSSASEGYYATLLHELTHWSGHASRLNRDYSGRFGGSSYALEELVAELGAAFLCADLAVANHPRADHAAYIDHWLSVLKRDKKALFHAAASASRAAAYLAEFSGRSDEPDKQPSSFIPDSSSPPSSRESRAQAPLLEPGFDGRRTMDERVARIRALNDELRTLGIGGRVMITVGVQHLEKPSPAEVLRAVRDFNLFTPENDPHGEHDCATLTVSGRTILWKIDYYDRDLRFHSPDAANPDVTCRVLTVMLAEEY